MCTQYALYISSFRASFSALRPVCIVRRYHTETAQRKMTEVKPSNWVYLLLKKGFTKTQAAVLTVCFSVIWSTVSEGSMNRKHIASYPLLLDYYFIYILIASLPVPLYFNLNGRLIKTKEKKNDTNPFECKNALSCSPTTHTWAVTHSPGQKA